MEGRNSKSENILLTGITGYLGSYLAKLFLQNGHCVYALVREKSMDLVRKRLEFWDNSIYKRCKNNLRI